MQFEDREKFVKYKDLKWAGILRSVKRSSNKLQPLLEALTNSLEAIKLRQRRGDAFAPYIDIAFHFSASVCQEQGELMNITVEDNGIGFDAENFRRLTTYKDDTKGFNNRGSGRIQLIHSFDTVTFDSVYSEGNRLMHREFILSKCESFLAENSILYQPSEPTEIRGRDVKTRVAMTTPLNPKDYAQMRCEETKRQLISHYLLLFCHSKPALPTIRIAHFVAGKETARAQISASDIPDPTHRNLRIAVSKYRISKDMKRAEPLAHEMVTISLLPYRISADLLPMSEIKVTSKGEISEGAKLKLTCIAPGMELGGYRFLFLLQSEHFDSLDSDERGNIALLNRGEFKQLAQSQGYIEAQILVNDIEEKVNSMACEIYGEIAECQKAFQRQLAHLKEQYFLSEAALADAQMSESVEDVFRKAYTYDAKVLAKSNATYENAVQTLDQLDPASPEYQAALSSLVARQMEAIPLQNRVDLSKYVVRRKTVIELMGRILARGLACQVEENRNVDEKLLHNLLFPQRSQNPLASDLWLINEEYMYFRGSSENVLSKVELDGERIFRDDFAPEEQSYLSSLGRNRMLMRADVLLFPSEGKCVIIEFKNPRVKVDEYLNQIARYAYFLRNFTKPKYEFLTFYGYLIGESIEKRDVQAADGDFLSATSLDYLVRPFKTVVDASGGNRPGVLYQEVIKFSTLQERAKIRNQAFIDRLLGAVGDSRNGEAPFLI